MDSPAGRGRAAGEVAGYLLKITSQVELELYIRKAATALQISEEAFWSELRRIQAGARRSDFSAVPPETAVPAPKPEKFASAPGLSAALLTLLELAISSEEAAKRLSELCSPEELGSEDTVGRALNAVIDAAQNGVHANAASLLGEMLIESPDPAVSRVLVEHREFADPEKALADSVAQLRRARSRESRAELLVRLRGTVDPAEKMAILKQISELR